MPVDLSAVPAEDLKAIASGDMSSVSEPTLRYLSGQPQGPISSIKPNTGLAGPLGDVVEAAGTPLDVARSALSHASSAVLDPILGLGARAYALLKGEDPNVAADAVHHWVANNTAHATTPGGRMIDDSTAQALGYAVKPFNAAGNALESTLVNSGVDKQTLEHGVGLANDVLGTAATVVPGVSEAIDAARATDLANPANVAKTGAEVGEAAGYKGLQSQQDLKLPGAQAVTDKLIADDAGLPQGQALNVPSVQGARAAGPGKVYDAAHAALPAQLTQDSGLTAAISGIGDTTSQLPRSPDVEALKETMLNQPDMTKDQLFANVQQARERAANFMASEDPDKVAVGQAYNSLANAYEDFIGRQLQANPGAGVTLEDFQNARTQFAKNYAAEAALKGGEHIDPMVYARILAKNPDLLTGNAKIVGQTAAALPAVPPFGVERGLVHAVGLAGGAGAAHLAGGGPAAELISGAASSAAAPYVARFLHNMFASGDVSAAGETANNPALSYFFKDGQLPENWNRSLPSRQQLLLGHDPAPTIVQGGENNPGTVAAHTDLGLTPDVVNAGAAHPGAPIAANQRDLVGQPRPFHYDTADLAPHPQNWSGMGPDGQPNFSLTGQPGSPAEAFAQELAAVLHQGRLGPGASVGPGVPEGILQRSAPGQPQTPVQAGLLPIEDALGLKGPAKGAPVKKGGASASKSAGDDILSLLGL